jgi:D-alanine transaminase
MSRIAYVNGRYVPHAEAAVHIEDRGYQFADGVYEVTAVVAGRLIDNDWHFERLRRSLRELQMALPMSARAMTAVMAETVRRNRVHNGIVYAQITRGSASRDHAFPARRQRLTLVVTSRRSAPQAAQRQAEAGIDVVSVPDIRWARCDIKSVSLLPNVLAKQAARAAGAYEAWQISADGFVTEGSSTNAWIVDRDGRLITHPLENAILEGITRKRLLQLAREAGIEVEERRFTLEEAKAAREAFITSTTAFVLPVVKIDDTTIANGEPGSVSLGLRELYLSFAQAQKAGKAAA